MDRVFDETCVFPDAGAPAPCHADSLMPRTKRVKGIQGN